MPELTPRSNRELSAEESAWLREFLSYEASELIRTDPEAQEAAQDLVGALGGSPPADNLTGWLDSETDAIDGAAQRVVEDAEQIVTAMEDPAPIAPDPEAAKQLVDQLAATRARVMARMIERIEESGYDPAGAEDQLAAAVDRLVQEQAASARMPQE